MPRSSRDGRDRELQLPSFSHFRGDAEVSPRPLRAGKTAIDQPVDVSIDGGDRDRDLEREHIHSLQESDLEALGDIGVFRSLELNDLALHRYRGDLIGTRKNIGHLSRAGLVRSRITYPERTIYLSLTTAGHRLLAANRGRENSNQKLYHGFVRTREARHDAALYRLYHQELGRIEAMGGKVRRVILDFELRNSINRRVAKLNSLPWAEQINQKQLIAREHGLRLVNGKIPLPDVRLEYEGPDQQLAKIDLELVTEHYDRGSLALKAKAGFAVYAFAEDAPRLRPAMQDPEIMLDILSL
jgi:DNA-binding MarR family transcriptional regulator